MPRGRGGYRKPSNPAPVSGPGALSARTDGGAAKPPLPTGQPYGARQQLQQLQSVGPMTDPNQSLPAGGGAPPPTQATAPGAPTNVFAPTERPGEPITAGIPLGAGPGGPMLPPDRHLRLRAMLAAAVEQDWPYQDQLRELLEQAGG